MKEQVVLEVQQSVVRQTDGSFFTLSCYNARSVSYSFGIIVRDGVFLLGRVYMGFKPFKSSKMDNAMKIDLMISSCHGLSPISMMI